MSDLMRSEFEAWAKDHEIYGDDGERFPMARLSGCYYENVQTQAAWEAWQASRERLVIELPADAHLSRDGLDENYLAGDMRDQIVESIHAAGVKYK